MAGDVIRDLIRVRSRPTVVRLEDLGSSWITDSFAVTREVATHLEVLKAHLAGPKGTAAFLIGHYGAGKTHFLAYLTESLRGGGFLDGVPAPDVVTASLLNYRSESALEGIVLRELLGETPADESDRRAALEAIDDRHPRGTLLILDEVSEFLRSKPSPQAFNEDVRYLQFLGEWARSHRFWVIAAMQEQIEHTGQLEGSLYRKIKDRFPLRMLLRPSHVRDLLRDGVLVQQPGAAEALSDLARSITSALPQAKVDAGALSELYPIHPATLEILEEVRGLFSQARGVVDFVLAQLEGDPARGVEPFLDRPWGDLITPEKIVDHFRDLFEVQPEFLPLAETVLPYYERHAADLFETEATQQLAWRVLKLLMLCHISPQREALTPEDASAWLLFRPSSISPDVNLQVVRRVLTRLADDGRFVCRSGSGFRLDLRDDGGARLDQLLMQHVAEIEALSEETVWALLTPLLGDEPFNLFALPRGEWQHRSHRWHFHDRTVAFYLGNDAPPPVETTAVCVRLPWGQAGAASVPTVVPPRIELTAELYEMAALAKIIDLPGAAAVQKLARRRLHSRDDLLGATIRNSYLQAQLHDGEQRAPMHVRLTGSTRLAEWLDGIAEVVLRRRFPSFERFAPAHGPLAKEAYRRLVRVASEHDLGSFEDDEYVKLIREGYLVPMGLMRRQGWSYARAAKVDRHELVQIVVDMAQHRPAPSAVYERLAGPVYGLVPDQVHVLLLYLALEGEIHLTKGKSSLLDVSETMPLPIQYDRLTLGSGLNAERLRALEDLCKGLKVRTPGQWSVAAQRQAIRRVSDRLNPLLEALNGLRVKIDQSDGNQGLVDRLAGFASRCGRLQEGDDEIQGFELFISEMATVRAFLTEKAALESLPRRIEALLAELGRLTHLLAHPALDAWPDPVVRTRIDALGGAPGLERPQLLEEWLQSARSAYEAYVADYRQRHEAWRAAVADDAVWKWRPDALASSRHIGVVDQVKELEQLRDKAQSHSCRGLCDLAYQPRCTCGFDGERGHVDDDLDRLRDLAADIDRHIRLFFRNNAVRARLKTWKDDGLEVNKETLQYLEGQRDCPRVADVALFDRYLAGVEVVRTVSLQRIASKLEGRVWSVPDVIGAIRDELAPLGDARLRLTVQQGDMSLEIREWCVEQSLRSGTPLPMGMHVGDDSVRVRPEWIGREALAALETLGLGPEVEDEVLQAVRAGAVMVDEAAPLSPLVRACLECERPTSPQRLHEMADLVRLMYEHHVRLSALVGKPWFDRLEKLSACNADGLGRDLLEILEDHTDSQWLIVDCAGVLLEPELRHAVAAVLTPWNIVTVEHAVCPARTTTDGFWSALAEAGIDHAVVKVNAIDRLLHERNESFGNLQRLVAAELEVSLRRVADQIDRRRPLIVLADHGFRMSPDGRSWRHGGPSWLERVVPVIELEPV